MLAPPAIPVVAPAPPRTLVTPAAPVVAPARAERSAMHPLTTRTLHAVSAPAESLPPGTSPGFPLLPAFAPHAAERMIAPPLLGFGPRAARAVHSRLAAAAGTSHARSAAATRTSHTRSAVSAAAAAAAGTSHTRSAAPAPASVPIAETGPILLVAARGSPVVLSAAPAASSAWAHCPPLSALATAPVAALAKALHHPGKLFVELLTVDLPILVYVKVVEQPLESLTFALRVVALGTAPARPRFWAATPTPPGFRRRLGNRQR